VRNPEAIADLPDNVCRALDLRVATRAVMLHHVTIAHMCERRSLEDIAIIFSVLARRKFNPTYCGRHVHDARLSFIVEQTFVASPGWVTIALKIVNARQAASGRDECWMSTAYAMGSDSLRFMLRNNRFAIVTLDSGR
jgi:hypothetical protein